MARFLVTNGSYYEPFTYDELVKPLAQMTEAQNVAADNYDTLSMETEALRRYISENEGDAQARALYDNYMKKLTTLQDNLWRNGFNAGTRRDLAEARAGYASDISRIATAVKSRQERSKEYWDAKHKNPDLITGDDPGQSGLDNYLNDDQYGSNWYSYSGTQFMNEVGTDAKARADEMFADPQLMRDPRLAGYITRIKREGFTGEEVKRAAKAVRQSVAGDDSLLAGLDPASAILASVLTSHLSSTGAVRGGNVSNNEYNRLVDYGVAGLAQAIGQTTYQDLSDKVWDAEMDFQKWKRQQEYTAKAKAAAEKAAGLRIEDTNTIMSTGENHDKAASDTARYSTNPSIRVFTKDGRELNNAVQASDLVYSGGLRRQAFERLGFDIGRDTKTLGSFTPSDKFLSGVIRNGDQTLYTRYDPFVRWTDRSGVKHKGGVVVNGDGVSEHVDIALTEYYNTVRRQYEDTVDYYKENEPDVYKAAKIDPDRQAKDYKKYNIGFDTPLDQFQEVVMHQPENSVMNYTTNYIARTGTDSGKYIERFADLLSGSMDRGRDVIWPFGSVGVKKGENWRQYEGTNMYIHEVSRYGTMSSKTADPDNIFDFDDNGRITNIEDIQITPASVAGGYVICKTTPTGKARGKSYSINIDMLNSNALKSTFNQAREALQYIADHPAEFQNPQISGYSSASEAAFDVIGGVSRKFKDILGYWTNTQSQGGSSQENRN